MVCITLDARNYKRKMCNMRDIFIQNAFASMNGAFAKKNIVVENGIFSAIGSVDNDKNLQVIDAEGAYAVPGFFDIHTHGAVNIDVNHAQPKDLHAISQFFASQGTTRWLASVLSDTTDQTIKCIRAIRSAMAAPSGGAALMGIHLEGPFLSAAFRGAMPIEMLRNGSEELLRIYQDEAGDALRYITLAPEVESIPEIVSLLKNGITKVALGHSGASYELSMNCIARGACAATHTFNGMKLFHQHEPGIMGAVLESDVYCEAICDGRHLHPGAVRMLIKAKGLSRILVVTDSVSAAGLPDGRYLLGANEIVVTNGDAMLADGSSRAGSTLTMQQALKNLKRFTGMPLEHLIPLMGENQARLFGLHSCLGSIDIGKVADVVILDKDLNVLTTIVAGDVVYKR